MYFSLFKKVVQTKIYLGNIADKQISQRFLDIFSIHLIYQIYLPSTCIISCFTNDFFLETKIFETMLLWLRAHIYQYQVINPYIADRLDHTLYYIMASHTGHTTGLILRSFFMLGIHLCHSKSCVQCTKCLTREGMKSKTNSPRPLFHHHQEP